MEGELPLPCWRSFRAAGWQHKLGSPNSPDFLRIFSALFVVLLPSDAASTISIRKLRMFDAGSAAINGILTALVGIRTDISIDLAAAFCALINDTDIAVKNVNVIDRTTVFFHIFMRFHRVTPFAIRY